MVGVVRDPRVEQVGEEFEERPARVEVADAVLHVATHPQAADVGDVRIQVALVREVLEQASLSDSRSPCNDVEAALREAMQTEFGLRGLDHRGAPIRIDASPCHRWHRVLPGVDDHWSYYCEPRHG